VLAGKRHITERASAAVEQRLVVGRQVIGQDKHHCILTLLERRSGYVIMKKLKARTTAEVTAAATRAITEPADRFHTLMRDKRFALWAMKRAGADIMPSVHARTASWPLNCCTASRAQ
jgi:IS30 family transposase